MEDGKRFESHQLLPDDLVLEAIARCGTIGDAIRGAAASTSLRWRIHDEPFLRRLRGFLDGGEIHGDGGGRPFIAALLLGLYQSGDPRPSFIPASDGVTKRAPSLAALPPPPANRDSDVVVGGACEFGPSLPVASRRSLLVLQRRCRITATEHLIEHGQHPIELSVCNPTTGQRLELPPHHVPDMSYALLDVDLFVAPSWSFKLLVAELSNDNPTTLHVQVFSSDSEQGHGGWGPVLACPITSRFGESRFMLGSIYGSTRRPSPVVLGDTVCWLCHSMRGDCVLTWRWRGGVAREACIVNPPPGHSFGHLEKCLAVLPSPAPAGAVGSHALLGLIVIESPHIQVWACEMRYSGSARDWKLWHCIREVTIPRLMNFSSLLRRANLSLLSGGCGARLFYFCEESGTLFLQPQHGPMNSSLFSVDMSPFLGRLDTMEVSKLEAREWELNQELEFFPYEVDLLSHMLICPRT